MFSGIGKIVNIKVGNTNEIVKFHVIGVFLYYFQKNLDDFLKFLILK